MENYIFEILDNKKDNHPISLDEMGIYKNIKKKLNTDLSEVCNVLRNMEKAGKVYRTNAGKYMLYKYIDLKIGRLSINKNGTGFVLMEKGPDIYIRTENMNGAIHSDLVVIEVNLNSNDEGKIVRVLERDIKKVVGEYLINEKNIGTINIDNKKININIQIDEKNRNNAMPGHKVLVELNEKKSNNLYKGKILEILGHKNDPGVDILSIAYENEIYNEFPEEVMKEANSLPKNVSKEDFQNRMDLRNKEIFTIDGEEAKDFDDAISIQKKDNGNYILGVHIADVDYYIKENSALYKEALNRGTSSYLLNTVINMFPKIISNGICSLNPNEDRLTLTTEMEINDKGVVVNNKIYTSVINSKKRMYYSDVNKILNGEKLDGYEKYTNTIFLLKELADKIRNNRNKRGFIDFDISEILIDLDNSGEPIYIGIKERGEGERIIEDFMIKANETIAEYVYNLDIPLIYRVHEKPDKDKINTYLSFLKRLGIKTKLDLKNLNSKTFQHLLYEVKSQLDKKNISGEETKKLYQIISEIGLRSVPKAFYSTDENLGHFGLASKYYCHSTSPIRRFPDLIVQNIVKKIIDGKMHNIEQLKKTKEKLVNISKHSSVKERNAIKCEREVEDMKKAEYMKKYIGIEYDGIISNIIQTGMFVRLDNLIEGFVRISDIPNDYYIYDEKTQSIIGRKSKKIYNIGNEVNIKVISSSKENRKIDFELVKKKKE